MSAATCRAVLWLLLPLSCLARLDQFLIDARTGAVNFFSSKNLLRGNYRSRRTNTALAPSLKFTEGAASWNSDVTSMLDKYIVVWQASGLDFDQTGIFGRIVDAVKSYEPFQVNTSWQGRQEIPQITSLAGGGFVVVWQSYQTDGSSWGIYGQVFDEFGDKEGNEFLVNSEVADSQKDPSLAPLSTGGFVVVWRSFQPNTARSEIHAQIFDNDGTKVGQEFQVSSTPGVNQDFPSVALLTDGFIVTWQSTNPESQSSSIYGRRFLNGQLEDEFIVNTNADIFSNTDPAVSSFNDSGFGIVWVGSNLLGESVVLGRVFDSTGYPEGGEFTISADADFDTKINPRIAALDASTGASFAVGWGTFLNNDVEVSIFGQIYARVMNDNPIKVLSQFLVNDDVVGDDSSMSLVSLYDGTLLTVYHGQTPKYPISVLSRIFKIVDNPLQVCAETEKACSTEMPCCDEQATCQKFENTCTTGAKPSSLTSSDSEYIEGNVNEDISNINNSEETSSTESSITESSSEEIYMDNSDQTPRENFQEAKEGFSFGNIVDDGKITTVGIALVSILGSVIVLVASGLLAYHILKRIPKVDNIEPANQNTQARPLPPPLQL